MTQKNWFLYGGNWLCVLLVLSLGACASLKWQKPQVSLAEVRVVGGNLLESRLMLKLRVRNENDRDITIENFIFDVWAGDFVVAKGIRNEPVVINRLSDTLVEIEATARTLELLRRLPTLVQSDGTVAYTVKGEALIRDYGKLPFERKDSLALPKLFGGGAVPAPRPVAPNAQSI